MFVHEETKMKQIRTVKIVECMECHCIIPEDKQVEHKDWHWEEKRGIFRLEDDKITIKQGL